MQPDVRMCGRGFNARANGLRDNRVNPILYVAVVRVGMGDAAAQRCSCCQCFGGISTIRQEGRTTPSTRGSVKRTLLDRLRGVVCKKTGEQEGHRLRLLHLCKSGQPIGHPEQDQLPANVFQSFKPQPYLGKDVLRAISIQV